MYIIKTISKNKNNSKEKYYTYRLVESIRVGDKIKQQTLLNLGSDFSVEQKYWSDLSKRVNEIIKKIPTLFELDKDLEKIANEYALQIISAKAKVQNSNTNNGDINNIDYDNLRYSEVALSTLEYSDIKSIGVENIAYETIKELGLVTKLKNLNLTNIQYNSAIGTIVAKIANPGSELASYDWLCNTSGLNELLGCNYNKISSNSIYKASDILLKHKDELEHHFYNKSKELFNYDETITLYDLTNTYFEGKAKGIEKAKRGRSKEKRADAPLITLALMLDSSGFVKKSKIFDGNAGEPATFKEMLDALSIKENNTNILNLGNKSLVVMDAGIASQENIDYLIDNKYEYIVVSRKKDKLFDEQKAASVKLNNKDETIVRAQKVINEETNEVELYVHSKDKELKEKSMQTRVQKIFLEKLQHLKAGLTTKGRTKEHEKVIEIIGRLKEKYSTIAQYYCIKTTKDPNGKNSIDISWKEKAGLDKKSALNGIYCLRTNNITMDEKTLWKTYTTLTDLEAVFKSLKSELGLRPIFHQKQSRVDGHLFITLLAYSIIHTIRYKLKAKSINYSWSTIRDILSSQNRITSSMRCKDGKTVYIRKSSLLNIKQKEIYNALNIKHKAGKTTEIYI